MNYNKYGIASIEAIKLLNETTSLQPTEAWEIATKKIFGEATPSQKKPCPRSTFLAICETGKLKGVDPGNYTSSLKNKNYALQAINLLIETPELATNKIMLWHRIPGCENKTHNSQMDVVISLLNSSFFSYE